MNPQIPTMLRLKNALLKLLPIRPEPEFNERGGIESRLSRLAKKVANPELSLFDGILVRVLLALTGLFLSGLILGNFHNAVLRVGFVICGMILPLVAVTRNRGQATLLALLWIFAASAMAFFPWPGRVAALLAIPTSLWLLAKMADQTWQADSCARQLYMLAHVGWLMVVLFQCGEGEWMLIFAAGAIGLFAARYRPGLAALVASGTLITVLNLLHGQSRLNLESLVPLLREPPCGVPRSWLMIIDAGWFGHARGPALGRAAAPEVADHWGWVGLIGIALLIALLIASTLIASLRASKWSFYTLITPLAAMVGTHLLLHLLFIIGCPVGISSLPMIGSGPECFIYSAMLTLIVFDRPLHFYDDLAPLRRKRSRRDRLRRCRDRFAG